MPGAIISCHEKTKVTLEHSVGQEIDFRNWNLGVSITETISVENGRKRRAG